MYLCPFVNRFKGSSGISWFLPAPCPIPAPRRILCDKPFAMVRVDWQAVPSRWRPILVLLLTQLMSGPYDVPRLTGLDAFAGQKQMARSFLDVGLAMTTFEMNDDIVLEDCLSVFGMQNFLQKLAHVSLKPGGFCWLGPPCGWWIWMSSSAHRRTSECPQGDTMNAQVVYHNTVAEFVADVILTCAALGIAFVLEQPLASRLPLYPAVCNALRVTNARRIQVSLWKFGCSSAKPLQLWGTAPWLQQLERLGKNICKLPVGATPGKGSTMTEFAFVPGPSSHLTTSDNGGSVTGRKEEMSESASYPACFCDVVAFMHKSHLMKLFVEQVVRILATRCPDLANMWFKVQLMQWLLGPKA